MNHNRPYLDAKANVCAQTIYALRAYYNEWTIINTLPDDVLSHIFLRLRTIVCRLDSESRRWMWAAYVCRHWRRVALATPELWTYNVLRIPELVKVFTRRSGSLPMTLSSYDKFGNYPFICSPDMTELLKSHRHRICHMRFSRHTPYSHDDGPEDILNTELPNLESVKMSSHFRYNTRRDISCKWVYDPIIAPQQQPLRSLYLDQVFTPWSSFIFADLRRLDLRAQVRDHTSTEAPSMDTFLNVLGRCPELKYLRLQHSGPTLNPDEPDPPATGRKVILRNLEMIILMNEPRDMTRLLQHLVTPEDTHHILYYSPSPDFSNVGLMKPTLQNLDDVTSIYFGSTNEIRNGIDLDDIIDDILVDVNFGPFVRDSLVFHASAESSASRLSAIFQTMDLRDGDHATLCVCNQSKALFEALPMMLPNIALEELLVTSSYAKFTTASWRSVFAHYPTLRTIRVQYPMTLSDDSNDTDMSHFLPILLDAINDFQAPNTLLCPNLEELDLIGMELNDDFEGIIRTFLQVRLDAGRGLKVLRMNSPAVWKGTREFTWPNLGDVLPLPEIEEDDGFR